MNEYLKHIFSDLQDHANKEYASPLELADIECELLLDYITNLQEAKLGNFHYRCPSNVKVSSKEDTIVYEMPEE